MPTHPTDPHPPETKVREPADDAIRRLLAEHAGPLYQFACRICGDRDEAEDLVQETFMNAYRAWGGFRGESSERTWIYRIAINACRRMHRPKSGEPDSIGSLDAPLPFGEPLVAGVPADQDDALQHQIHEEARRRLERAIVELPMGFRVPMILKEIAELPVRDVARILGLEEGTVRSRVHRARLKLRASIDAAIPRDPDPAPPPAYDQQTCLDLLGAKQEALDRGVPFGDDEVCRRCRSVFASLDLTQDLCRDLARDELPGEIRDRLERRIEQDARGRRTDPGVRADPGV